jgi:hypothetical protein
LHSLITAIPFIHSLALDAAIRSALGAKFLGLRAALNSSNTPTFSPSSNVAGAINLDMADAALSADDTTATNLAATHDPVFLSVSKTSIIADGIDSATITITAPKSGAAVVTLICNGPNGLSQTISPVLSGGVATDTFQTNIAGTYTITVQNPANRSTDQLIITAV